MVSRQHAGALTTFVLGRLASRWLFTRARDRSYAPMAIPASGVIFDSTDSDLASRSPTQRNLRLVSMMSAKSIERAASGPSPNQIKQLLRLVVATPPRRNIAVGSYTGDALREAMRSSRDSHAGALTTFVFGRLGGRSVRHGRSRSQLRDPSPQSQSRRRCLVPYHRARQRTSLGSEDMASGAICGPVSASAANARGVTSFGSSSAPRRG